MTDAHGRDHVTTAKMGFDKAGQDHRLQGRHDRQYRRLHVAVFQRRADLSLCHAAVGPVRHPKNIYCNVRAVYTNTVPVDAYRGAGRPEATYVVERMIETAARELGLDPAELRRKNFITEFPHQTPVIMTYDAGDFGAISTRPWRPPMWRISRPAGPRPRRAASCAGSAIRPISRPAGSRPRPPWVQPGRGCRPVGIGRGAGEPGRHRRGADRRPQPRPGPRDDIRPARRRPLRHPDRERVDRAWRHRQGAVRHGHLWLALGRGGMSAIVRALDKVEAKAKKIAAHVLEASEDDIVIEGGEVKVAGTDKRWAGTRSGSRPIPRTTCPPTWSRA
jgi:carbon-monoxide dehydrogenase large subunit